MASRAATQLQRTLGFSVVLAVHSSTMLQLPLILTDTQQALCNTLHGYLAHAGEACDHAPAEGSYERSETPTLNHLQKPTQESQGMRTTSQHAATQ